MPGNNSENTRRKEGRLILGQTWNVFRVKTKAIFALETWKMQPAAQKKCVAQVGKSMLIAGQGAESFKKNAVAIRG